MYRRATLAAGAFLAAAWLLGLGGLLPSSNRWFLVLLAPALVYRRGLLYVRDFAPLALAVLVYEWARTTAHRINPDPFYRPQIDVDKVIGLGRVPTRAAAGLALRRHAGRLRARARQGALLARRGTARRALPALARLPPRVPARGRRRARLRVRGGDRLPRSSRPPRPGWRAATGLIGPLERIREHGHQCPTALTDPSLVTRLFDDNPVAAVPSLHGAWSTLVALIIWRWRPRLWPIGVAYALVQQFAVVYLGEHYVADLIVGDALALGMWWLSGRLVPGRPTAQARASGRSARASRRPRSRRAAPSPGRGRRTAAPPRRRRAPRKSRPCSART